MSVISVTTLYKGDDEARWFCDAYGEWRDKCLDLGSKSQKIAFKISNFCARKIFIVNPFLDKTKLKLNCQSKNAITCKTIWEDPKGESCTIYQDKNYCTDKGRKFC